MRTAEDGSFRYVVPPGPGHLLFSADDPNLIPTAVSDGELASGKVGGPRRYYDAVLPLDLQVKDGPKDLTVRLRRCSILKPWANRRSRR